MRITILLVTAIVVVIGIGAALAMRMALGSDKSDPIVMIPEVDFGNQEERRGIQTIAVRFTNPWPTEARLAAVRTGCGCIGVSDFKPKTFLPKETVEVDLLLDRTRMAYGTARYPIEFIFDDSRSVRTVVSYSHIPAIDVTPSFLTLLGSTGATTFDITRAPDSDDGEINFRINPDDTLKLTQHEDVTRDDGYRISRYEVISTQSTPTDVDGSIEIAFGTGEMRSLPYRIIGDGVGRVSPRQVSFDLTSIQRADTLVRTIMVPGPPQEWAIDQEALPAYLHVARRSEDAKDRHKLDLVLDEKVFRTTMGEEASTMRLTIPLRNIQDPKRSVELVANIFVEPEPESK